MLGVKSKLKFAVQSVALELPQVFWIGVRLCGALTHMSPPLNAIA